MKPTVSQLLDLLNKPALMKWANDLGLKGESLDEFYKKSKSAGLKIHEQIERFIKTKTPMDDALQQHNLNVFLETHQIINIEQNIETEYFYGRYDALIMFEDKLYLADFKSNKRLYFDNILQMCAYRMALENKNVGIARVSIPDFEFNPVINVDYVKYEQILINLSNIYQLKKLVG